MRNIRIDFIYFIVAIIFLILRFVDSNSFVDYFYDDEYFVLESTMIYLLSGALCLVEGIIFFFFYRSKQVPNKWLAFAALIFLACAVYGFQNEIFPRPETSIRYYTWTSHPKDNFYPYKSTTIAALVCFAASLLISKRHEGERAPRAVELD